MNKFELKQIEMVKVYLANGMTDTAARSVSALVRAARTAKSKATLMQFAQEHGITKQPEFIV